MSITLKSQIEQAKGRFDEKFPCIQAGCDGQGHVPRYDEYGEPSSDQCEFHSKYLFRLDDFLATEITAAIEEYKKAVKVEKIDLIKQGYKISHEQFAKSWNDALSEIEAKDREWREGK